MPAMAGQSMFDNVFVNPSAYRAFEETGTWPDKTTLVLEVRGAEGPSSINKRGHSQSQEVMGMEVHVKDAKLEGGWGFYEFDGPGSAKLVKRPASCYECHEESRCGGYDLCSVLSDAAGAGEDEGDVERAFI